MLAPALLPTLRSPSRARAAQVHSSPFRDESNGFVAVAVSACLVIFFLLVLIYKYSALTELEVPSERTHVEHAPRARTHTRTCASSRVRHVRGVCMQVLSERMTVQQKKIYRPDSMLMIVLMMSSVLFVLVAAMGISISNAMMEATRPQSPLAPAVSIPRPDPIHRRSTRRPPPPRALPIAPLTPPPALRARADRRGSSSRPTSRRRRGGCAT